MIELDVHNLSCRRPYNFNVRLPIRYKRELHGLGIATSQQIMKIVIVISIILVEMHKL
jgi:hypothetical protein